MMKSQETVAGTIAQERNILLALIYFDIFDYPLTSDEIVRFAPGRPDDDFEQALEGLVSKKAVFLIEGFYSLRNDRARIVRRQAGNILAEKKMNTARKFGRLMSSFPFVRGIMLSGSISKGYMDRRSDIDYFIITEPGRLWLVRTMLALFRRIFLLNSHKYFCTNYFVARNLEIGEKNIFTAVETSTLKPLYGARLIHHFQAANTWCDAYLPNRVVENGLKEERELFLKSLGEKFLSIRLFDGVDGWLMNQSLRYWRKKYGSLLNDRDFLVAFQSTPEVSRAHPNFYQKRVLSEYIERIRSIERQHGISLSI